MYCTEVGRYNHNCRRGGGRGKPQTQGDGTPTRQTHMPHQRDSGGASKQAKEEDLHEEQGGGGQAADSLSCKEAMRERMEHRKRESPFTSASSRTGGRGGGLGARDDGNQCTRPYVLDRKDMEEQTSRTDSDETTKPVGAPRLCGTAKATPMGMTCTAGAPVGGGLSCLGSSGGAHTMCREKALSRAATLYSAPIIDRQRLVFRLDLTENTSSNGWREL